MLVIYIYISLILLYYSISIYYILLVYSIYISLLLTVGFSNVFSVLKCTGKRKDPEGSNQESGRTGVPAVGIGGIKSAV